MSQKSVQNRDLFAQSFLSCRANARTYVEPRRDHVELIYRVRVGAVVVVVLAEADDTSNSVFQN